MHEEDRLFSLPNSRVRARVIIEESEDGRRVQALEYLNGNPHPIIMSPTRMVFLLQRVSMEFTMALLADTEFEEYVNAANNKNDQNIQ